MKFVYFMSLLGCAVLFNSCTTDSSEEQSSGAAEDFPSKAVDLGLPSGIKWASCNIGATKPEDYGDYYAWGEIEEKKSFLPETYLYYKYVSEDTDDNQNWINIGSEIIGTEYDVAHVKWGSGWRMPTKAEMEELLENCIWTWTTYNGVNGQKVTGPNGNSIFLPATGDSVVGTEVNERGVYGGYWSGTLNDDDSYCSYDLYFYDDGAGCYGSPRSCGHSIRPVTD